MSNFTPINPKKINQSPSKKKFNFLLWGNLILVVLIAIVGLVYYNQTLQTTKQKATTRKPFGCIGDKNVNNYLQNDGNCAWVKSNQKTNFEFGQYFFCEKDGASGCPHAGVPAQESYVFRPPTYGECFKKNCGTEQIDFKFNDAECFYSRIDNDCNSNSSPTKTPTPTTPPTNTPTPTTPPTNTPTPTTPPTNTPTPTLTTLPTNTPTIPPTNTPPNNPSSTPTEIILVQTTNTPIQSSPTSTPPQQIAQTGDLRSSWVFAVPIGVILLGLLL